MRFPLEVFEAMRTVWPKDRALGIRVSATDYVEGGWDLEQTIAFAKELKARGCDFIDASGGGLHPSQKIELKPGYQVPFAEAIRRETGLPTMAVGLIDKPEHADELVATGKADMIAMARAFLFDPHWVWHAAEALGEPGAPAYPPQYKRSHAMFLNRK